MYKKPIGQIDVYSFVTPFGGILDKNNRWVKFASCVPWDEIEDVYATKFSKFGPPAKPLRMVLGTYILKREYGFTDNQMLHELNENPYLQYFIGLDAFTLKVPVSATLLRSFKKRFSVEDIDKIDEIILGCRKALL